MSTTPTELQKILGLKYPFLQAPMAGADSIEMAIGVAKAGGLGALACAFLSLNEIRKKVTVYQNAGPLPPLNLNFFCHPSPAENSEREMKWIKSLESIYKDLGLSLEDIKDVPERQSFNESHLVLIKELGVRVVSFHFGLPIPKLVKELKDSNVVILASATDFDEAKWLVDHGTDFVIAQGAEAGGHRSSFLQMNPLPQVSTKVLTQEILRNLQVPVIAAGGIATPDDMKFYLNLGATAVQLGTLFLYCAEAQVSKTHRQSLQKLRHGQTTLTNIFSGRPARAINNQIIQRLGPLSNLVPEFPRASKSMAPIRKKADETANAEYLQMWSGEKAGESWQWLLKHGLQSPTAEELTRMFCNYQEI